MPIRPLIFALCAAFSAAAQPAAADEPLFHGEEGVAVGGYDTVAFFSEGRPVAGRREYSVMWKGVIWRFATAGNQEVFESNPRAYAPRFGGYCAYAVSQGYLASGDPDNWQIINGHLYVLHNDAVHRMWRVQAADLIAQARGNWPDILRD